jgi:hypothetical protein
MSLDCMAMNAMCAAWLVLGGTIVAELVVSLTVFALDLADALAPLARELRT